MPDNRNMQDYRSQLVARGLSEADADDIISKMLHQQEQCTVDVETVDEVSDFMLTPPPAVAQEAPPPKPLSDRQRELLETGGAIRSTPPSGDDLTFMHSLLCQVGLPRAKVAGLEFERTCGSAGLYVRAGKLWDGKQFVQQPVPYGPMPRLVMAWLNTAALRNKSPVIDVGSSASDFLRKLGKESSGGKTGSYTNFRKQISALSACTMTLGYTAGGRAITYDGKPIQQFEAWLSNNEGQPALWPGVITFSPEYYQTLAEHAVPLDLRALNSLTGSALAMDIYTMLADRLHRINGRPIVLHWRNLRDQFGQEYIGKNAEKDFKKKFLIGLKNVLAVYPQAKVSQVKGGVLMMPSPPPIPYKR